MLELHHVVSAELFGPEPCIEFGPVDAVAEVLCQQAMEGASLSLRGALVDLADQVGARLADDGRE
jgi:hypothetical protein